MALDIGAFFKIKAGVEGQAQIDKLNKSLDDTKQRGGALGQTFTDLKGRILGVVAATAGIVAFGRAMVGAASEAEQASNRITATLKATAFSAGLAKFEIDELADSLAATTQFDDESIRNASAQFLKFGNIQGEVFKDGIRLATDLAAFMGSDVVTAAQTVGKALSSPAEAIGTLERQIGKLSPAQEKMIKDLVEQNRLAEAQAAVLTILQGKIGGTAEIMNTGLLKATSDVKKAWDEMLESLGKTKAVQSTAGSFLTFLKDSLNDIKRIVEDDSWIQKLKGLYLFGLGFRNFDMSPKGPAAPGQAGEAAAARAAADKAARERDRAAWEEGMREQQKTIDEITEDRAKKAQAAAEKQAAENKRLLDEGTRGWVAYADEVFRQADELNIALAKIADERNAYEETMRKKDIDGWVAYIEELERQWAQEAQAMADFFDKKKDKWDELKDVVQGWGREATDAFADWAFGAKGNIRDVAATMLKEFAKMMLFKNVFDPLAKAGGDWLSTTFRGLFGVKHAGGVVGEGGGRTRAVSPAVFAGAPRLHTGLASDEFPTILQKGETVIPRGGSAVAAGMGNVIVHVNAGGSSVEGDTDRSRQLGRMIGDSVRGILLDEKRPGGLLA